MASRASLNKVMLIGNLTRDPELRYTPSGAAVCSFTVATNRAYVASDGNKKEETEFTRVVSWNKLAELCSQLLSKGRKVYVEGRLSTRSWESPDGQQKSMTEVVIDDMRILDSKRQFEGGSEDHEILETAAAPVPVTEPQTKKEAEEKVDGETGEKEKDKKEKSDKKKEEEEEDLNLDDLPF
ncbi:single-stranded DNA-binding protein [Candidatus Curtissbacteria bacterium]|nr:single-stranded DNA-binding protein [Candidatus Curtissbacteria bacterium]